MTAQQTQLFRLSDRAVLRIAGADRVTWLNGVVTCDVAKMKNGDARYGLAVTQKGRILADFYAICLQDTLIAALPASELESVHQAFEKYLVMEDCELTPDPKSAVWQVVGANAGLLLEAARAKKGVGGLVSAELAVVVAEESAIADVEAALSAALASVGGVVVDETGREIFRQELAVPRFGLDFDLTTYPQEAGLEKRAVAFDKGCYLGQEVVCMLELRGHVKRKLVSLAVDGAATPKHGDDVLDSSGEKIGQVTSASVSPTLGVLALAMVKAVHAEAGTELKIGDAKAKVRSAAA
jgi:tRNA-modifying protein YgfZ